MLSETIYITLYLWFGATLLLSSKLWNLPPPSWIYVGKNFCSVHKLTAFITQRNDYANMMKKPTMQNLNRTCQILHRSGKWRSLWMYMVWKGPFRGLLMSRTTACRIVLAEGSQISEFCRDTSYHLVVHGVFLDCNSTFSHGMESTGLKLSVA